MNHPSAENGVDIVNYPQSKGGQTYNSKEEKNDSTKKTSLDELLSSKSLKRDPLFDKTMEELKNKVIQELDNHSTGSNYWKSLDELAKWTGLASSKVEYIMENSEQNSILGSFIQNVRGFWTTRNLYEKHTPFLRKIYDAYTLRFN